MRAKWVMLLALVVLPVLASAQPNRREFDSNVLDRGDGGTAAPGFVLNFSEVFATDPQFRNLPIRPISGQVTIVIQPVTFSISDTLSGAPGDTIAVPVMLARSEHRLEALGAAIKATNRLLSYTGFVAGVIVPGPQLNVSAPAPDSVRLAYLNFGGGPIANDGVLAMLYFRIDPNAKSGDISTLSFHDLTAADSTFQKLPVQNVSGKVTVVIRPTEIRGMTWHDLNGNAKKDPNEPGLKGWEIKLTSATTQSAITDSLGNYVFMSLVPGTYTIAEVLQTGWQQAFPPVPGTHTVELRPDQVLDSLDFGNWMPGSIQGTLWHDKNLDGKKNDGESLLEGWQINLTGPDTLSTNTGAAGNYRFENLAPGIYKISEVLRPQWRQTFPVAPDTAYVVILTSGQHVGDINFANEPPVSAGREKNLTVPENFVLFQNYPNPFGSGATSHAPGEENPGTTIKYGVPRQSRVKLEVINALGMRVALLTDEVHQPGYYEVKLDRTDLPGGIYFYRLTTNDLVKTMKLLLVK